MLRPFLCLLAFASAAPAMAEDWPEFRGPGRQGLSAAKGLPLAWNANEHVVWKQELAGEGWSSPAVVKDRIYLTSAVPVEGGKERDMALRTLCLNAETGKPVWDVEVFKQEHDKVDAIHKKNSHASPSPLVYDGRVYVHFGPQGTACLSAEDGKILWSTRELSYHPQHGNGGSPELVDGVLVLICNGLDQQFVVGLDAKSGEIKWKKAWPPLSRAQKFSFATPLAIEVAGRRQVVCPGTNNVVAYDPQTGDEIWQAEYTGYSVIPRPVFAHGLVFLSTSYNTPSLLAIKPDGKGDVTKTHIVWQTNRAAPHTPSLLAVGDELYAISDKGIATCFDAKTGTVHWAERLGGNHSASPLYADGRIYFQDEEGTAIVIKAGKTFEELGRNTLPGRTLASYGVFGKSLLIRTDGALYRIEE